MVLSDDLAGYKSSGGILLPPPLKTHTGCLLKSTPKNCCSGEPFSHAFAYDWNVSAHIFRK